MLKKRPTYLPKLKLMGKSTANKYVFKDGLWGLDEPTHLYSLSHRIDDTLAREPSLHVHITY